jgi:hypothetical protein
MTYVANFFQHTQMPRPDARPQLTEGGGTSICIDKPKVLSTVVGGDFV